MVAGMYRMGAAISFAIMLLVIGIPLWWKTTEVHRAALPYRQINSIIPSNITIRLKIYIACPLPRFEQLVNIMKISFQEHSVLEVDPIPFKITSSDMTFENLEKSTAWLPNDIVGNLVLVEVPNKDNYKIIVNSNRIIYITPDTNPEAIITILKDQLLQDDRLQNKITAIVTPGSLKSSDGTQKAMRASPNYDVIVSVVNSDPSHINVDWALPADLNRYIQPLMDQIADISSHAVKSQWLYLLDLGELPKKDSAGVNVISFSQLPHIITPLEKKLGFGISRNPCVHLVLFVVSCAQRPMSFSSESGDYVDSMISPLWGGAQLLNPTAENCENGTTLVPNSKQVIGLFTAQFHSLLGVARPEAEGPVRFIKPAGPLLSDWALDSLFRSRIVEQITSASLTLKSLSKLLGEIGNIVINEDVASSINLAVEHVTKAKSLLIDGRLVDALHFSKSAFSASEQAFSNPSLLALLYFPDDQKYAVYIPLFLPIMIPVLMSLKRIYTGVFLEESTF